MSTRRAALQSMQNRGKSSNDPNQFRYGRAMSDPVVFLPGMMCDARVFAPQIADLSRDHTVVCAPLSSEDRIETMARRVLEGLPEKFALAGLSMGAILAMEVIRTAPRRVTRLALLDTNPAAETPEVAAKREPLIAGVKAGRLEEVMRDEVAPTYLADGPNRIDIMNVVMDMARASGPKLFESQSRALQRRPDQTSGLSKINVPTLVACGRDDKLCPLARHEFMAGVIQGATLEVFEGAGHLPTLEVPDQVNAALRRWLTDTLLLV